MAAELCCTASAGARRWLVVDGAIAVVATLWFAYALSGARYGAAAVMFVAGLVSGFRAVGGLRVQVRLTDDRLISHQVLGTIKIKRAGIVEVTVEPFRGQLWRLGMLNGRPRPLHHCVVLTRGGKRIALQATRDLPTPGGTPGPHVVAAARRIDRWLASTPVAT
jgi:hypothetical protein